MPGWGRFLLYDSSPRLSPEPLPPYHHWPGKTPHPVRDPDGHLYGLGEANPPPWSRDRWHESPAYLFGIDLYNHAYYWEAHEAWEALWKEADEQMDRLFLQGLIQVSAALLKREMGNFRGLERLADKGLQKLRAVHLELPNGRSRFGGLCLSTYTGNIQCIAESRTYPDWPADPRILVRPREDFATESDC